jgi:hypothetical protein
MEPICYIMIIIGAATLAHYFIKLVEVLER